MKLLTGIVDSDLIEKNKNNANASNRCTRH